MFTKHLDKHLSWGACRQIKFFCGGRRRTCHPGRCGERKGCRRREALLRVEFLPVRPFPFLVSESIKAWDFLDSSLCLIVGCRPGRGLS